MYDQSKSSLCLLCWDVCLGGYFHGRNDLTYGVDVSMLRLLGVLQVALLKFQFRFVLDA